MARMFTGNLKKTIGQLVALAVVIVAVAAFLVTQLNNTSAQAENSAQPLDVELVSETTPLSHLSAQLPNSVKLTVGGETTALITHSATVGQALEDAGIKVSKKDRVSPDLDTTIADGQKITVKKVTTEEVVETKSVDFETKEVKDDKLEKGKTKVETEGVKGEAEVTFTITAVDGKEESRKETDRTVTKEPVTKVVKVGTKEPANSGSSSDSDSSSGSGAAPSSGVWAKLAQCESGGNWKANTGNGYHGGLQFSQATWQAMGGGKYGATADQATPAQQIEIATKLQQRAGWGQWPACSSALGLR